MSEYTPGRYKNTKVIPIKKQLLLVIIWGIENMVWGCATGTGFTGMMGYGGGGWWIFSWLIGLGIVVLIWLLVIKLWREVMSKKKR